MSQIRQALEAKSGGVIQAENVSFMQGEAPSELRTAVRYGGRAMVVAGAAYDAYRIATAENKVRTASSVAGGWTGAWAGGEVGAATGARNRGLVWRCRGRPRSSYRRNYRRYWRIYGRQ